MRRSRARTRSGSLWAVARAVVPTAIFDPVFVAVLSIMGLSLVGCKADPQEPVQPAREGSVSFTYQGDIAGSFVATGALSNPISGSFSAALFAPTIEGDRLHIIALRERADGLYDILDLIIPFPEQVGAYPILETGGFAYRTEDVGRSMPPIFIAPPEHNFRLHSGELFVSELSDSRIRGGFSAQGEDVDPLREPTSFTIDISEGSFDLPVLLVPPT